MQGLGISGAESRRHCLYRYNATLLRHIRKKVKFPCSCREGKNGDYSFTGAAESVLFFLILALMLGQFLSFSFMLHSYSSGRFCPFLSYFSFTVAADSGLFFLITALL